MEALQYSLEAVDVLFNAGLLTKEEMELRRQWLVAEYIGYPGAPASGYSDGAAPTTPEAETVASRAAPALVGDGIGESPSLEGLSSASSESPVLSELSAAALRVLLGPPDAPVATPEDTEAAWACSVKVMPLLGGVTAGMLEEAFSVFGEVHSAVVNNGTPNYGHVRFLDPLSAQRAAEQGVFQIGTTQCSVRLSRWRAGKVASEPPPSNYLGLFNLPFTTKAAQLKTFLSTFPGFVKVRMMLSSNGRFRGHAFAEFATSDDATLCKAVLTGMCVNGQTVDVRFGTQPRS
eukprot:RCo029887